MNAICNMPLFHGITATELPGDDWNREAGELAAKLRAWLDGSRCVCIFTDDDFFHHELYFFPDAYPFSNNPGKRGLAGLVPCLTAGESIR